MALVEIKIAGRIYKLSCADDEKANLEKVGEQLNYMAADITANAGNVNESMLLLMLAVLAKDEANKTKSTETNNNQNIKAILEKVSEIIQKIEKH